MTVCLALLAGQDSTRASNSAIFIETANDFFREGNMRHQERDYASAVIAYQEAIRVFPGKGIKAVFEFNSFTCLVTFLLFTP